MLQATDYVLDSKYCQNVLYISSISNDSNLPLLQYLANLILETLKVVLTILKSKLQKIQACVTDMRKSAPVMLNILIIEKAL